LTILVFIFKYPPIAGINNKKISPLYQRPKAGIGRSRGGVNPPVVVRHFIGGVNPPEAPPQRGGVVHNVLFQHLPEKWETVSTNCRIELNTVLKIAACWKCP